MSREMAFRRAIVSIFNSGRTITSPDSAAFCFTSKGPIKLGLSICIFFLKSPSHRLFPLHNDLYPNKFPFSPDILAPAPRRPPAGDVRPFTSTSAPPDDARKTARACYQTRS